MPLEPGKVALLAALLAGCSGGEQPAGAVLGGHWVSTFSSEFVGLELKQAGSRVTGRAELAPGGARSVYHAKGIMRGSDLTLSLLPDAGGDAVTLRGTLARDTLKVRLDGGGFRDRFVPLVRME
jgi:hypothetical protein